MTSSDLFSKINEIIHSDYIHSPPKILTESAKGAKCNKVQLEYSGRILTYKFDAPTGKNLTPFFNMGNAGAMSDYLIFCLKGSNIHVFICNLKSNNPGNTVDQVQAGFAFAQFLITTAARCINKDRNHIPDYVTFKAVHFTTRAVRGLTNTRLHRLEQYGNGLKHLQRHCDKLCSLDILIAMQ